MRAITIVFSMTALVVGAAGCPSFPGDLCRDGFCDPSDAGASSSSGGGDGGDGGIIKPPGCDLTKDPKDSPACVDDGVGIFVSPTGSDTASGKKGEPVKTIQQALKLVSGGRPRVYVCGDETSAYAGPVVLSSTEGVSLYGGFECVGWAQKGAKSKVSVSGGGDVALDLEKVKGAAIQDFVFEGPAEGLPNSVAVRVTDSKGVDFRRVKAVAGNGKSFAKADDGGTGAKGENGNPASGTTPGGLKACLCGGSGGGGGSPGGDGQTGSPNLGGAPPENGGVGLGGIGCGVGEPNGTGNNGASPAAAGAAAKVTTLGTVTAREWSPSGGVVGATGNPGQGGGGGGGRDGTSAGGSGGCGGCGGLGGKGGAGGGGSVGFLLVGGGVTFQSVEAVTRKGGAGGAGGAGGPGGMGGTGGGSLGGCGGGDGGQGGKGGAGSGGAGGVSVGVLYKGEKPPGADSIAWTGEGGGEGGGEGEAGAGNSGPKGTSEKLTEVP